MIQREAWYREILSQEKKLPGDTGASPEQAIEGLREALIEKFQEMRDNPDLPPGVSQVWKRSLDAYIKFVSSGPVGALFQAARWMDKHLPKSVLRGIQWWVQQVEDLGVAAGIDLTPYPRKFPKSLGPGSRHQ